jgi:hypothetical protein
MRGRNEWRELARLNGLPSHALEEDPMAVLSFVTLKVKPGRMSDLMAGVKELQSIEQRLGKNLRSMRLFEAQVGGSDTGLMALAFEYDDLASWGATVDAERQDRAFQAQMGTPDDPAELVGQTLFVEIPF